MTFASNCGRIRPSVDPWAGREHRRVGLAASHGPDLATGRFMPPSERGSATSRGGARAVAIGQAERAEPRSIEISMLGDFTVIEDAAEVALPASRKARALLAFLAAAERPVRRERLCEIFWELPDDPRGALRWSLSRLRRSLGGAIEANRETVRLRREILSIDYDVVRNARGLDPASLATTDLEAIADMFRGGFLDNLAMPRCPEFEAWRIGIAHEVEVFRLRTLRSLIDRLRHEPVQALRHAHALLALCADDPSILAETKALAEASRREIMVASARPARTPAIATG